MDIKLLKCRDEDNAFPKRLYEGITVSGTLKGECDILAPIITFGGSNAFSNLKYFNYAYIPDYERYYFISELNLVANGLIECSMVVDVLESWKDKILQLECVVARNEFEKDPYIIDDLVIMTPTKRDYIYQQENHTPIQGVEKISDVKFFLQTASNDITVKQDRYEENRKMPYVCTGGSMYKLDYQAGMYVLSRFWETAGDLGEALTKLYVNYSDRASLVISFRVYPFDVDSFSLVDYYDRVTSASDEKDWIFPINVAQLWNLNSIGFGDEKLLIGTSIGRVWSNPQRTYFFDEDFLQTLRTNSYMDYATISEYKMYIPYFGYIDLDQKVITDSKRITVNMCLDLINGDMNVVVTYTNYNDEDIGVTIDSVKCGVDCYVSGTDLGIQRDKVINTTLSALGSVANFVSPSISKTVGSITNKVVNTRRNASTGRQITTSTKTTTKDIDTQTTNTPSIAGSVIDTISGIMSLNSTRLPFSISTNTPSAGVFLNDIYNVPTIIIRRPEQKYYTNYGHYVGYPLYKTRILTNCTGYTKIQDVHVNIPCTNTERQMIGDALKAGVILNNVVNTEPQPEVRPDTPPTPETPSLSEPPTMFNSPFIGQFKVKSPYGMRILNGEQEFHKGIDLVGIDTDRVTSIGSGVVDAVGWENPDNHNQGFGYRVRILNADETYTYYGHLQENSSPLVVGQSINEFDLIGIMGATGGVTGRHTCLSIRPISGGSIDPSIVTGIPNASGTYKFVRS